MKMLREYFYNLATDKAKGIAAPIFKFMLFLISLIYAFLVTIIRLFYNLKILQAAHLNCKVISVGNIAWGGTGKTPVVEMLAKLLNDSGHKVAIQSRGYKGSKSDNAKVTGDEPLMLQENLGRIPIITGKKRLSLAKSALEIFSLDTVILDDGFQHWKIHRDLDIVAIDATNPFGNGFLIPRGILREPLNSLRRADIFFLTRADETKDLSPLKQELKELNKNALIISSLHSPDGFYNILDIQRKNISTVSLLQKKIAFVTAIGNPEAFENTLLKLGLKVSLKFIFLDHYEFTKSDFDKIINQCIKEGISTLLTTQKDAVKLKQHCSGLNKLDILVLRIKIKITENEDLFFHRLFGLYNR